MSEDELLTDVADLGRASLELVAWHRDCEPEEIADCWAALIAAGRLHPAGDDPHTGERMYRIRLRQV